VKTGLIQFTKGDNPYKKVCYPNLLRQSVCVQQYNCAAILRKRYWRWKRHQ